MLDYLMVQLTWNGLQKYIKKTASQTVKFSTGCGIHMKTTSYLYTEALKTFL
ncbi:hypothetical protein ING2E5B_0469 [Fermentimonas caenicola]|jgi:hypothetical protein|uniref:Uncharacterized protein n=1 Tax=Fermentimonas caenicola TaxID=1562970 RepID=A0A098BYI2_9BACT|nr:hypothetical protein ING2E5B_0469 [Fermentimonas caenicola]